MKNIHNELDDALNKLLTNPLNEREDVFNVDWDVYYDTIFPIKEKIKFKLGEFITALPYHPNAM